MLRHLKTIKHNSIKSDFNCRACNYTCSVKSVMDRHTNSQKHKTNQEKFTEPEPEQVKESELMTIIQKLLIDNSELKNFIIEQAIEHKNSIIEQASDHKNSIIKQASDHKNDTKELMLELSKNINNGNNTINSHNKAFNITLYLGEQCKNAMDFSEFIRNVVISREELENNAQLGFVGGISKILIDRLKLMDVTDRPMHCTDLKRETMYIKDDGKWVKEENNDKLNKAIQAMTCKSVGALLDWKSENPDYKNADSAFSQRCIVIQQQSMAGHNRELYYSKVIRALAKEVFVNK